MDINTTPTGFLQNKETSLQRMIAMAEHVEMQREFSINNDDMTIRPFLKRGPRVEIHPNTP